MNVFKELWQPVYKSQRGISTVVSKLIVVIMMGCLGYGYAQMLRRFSQIVGRDVDAGYLAVFSILVSAEAMLTHARTKEMDGREKWIFRSAEILTILLLFKLFLLMIMGIEAALLEISTWQIDFFNAFFSPSYIAGFLILGMVWVMSTYFASDIDDLNDREQDASWDELGKVQNALHAIRARIIVNILLGGGFTLFFAVGARLNLRSFVPILREQFDASVPVANVLLYFFLSLILMSQTQFALLRTRWMWSKTAVARHLARNWIAYGVAFFFVIAVLSFLLPTTYSLGFFETIAYLMNLLGLVFRFLISLALLPLTLCARLFPNQEGPAEEPAPAAAPPPPPAAADGGPSALWQFIQSLLFWGIFLAVVIFALSQYIRANAYFFRRLTRLPLISWFASLFQALWAWVIGANRTVAGFVKASIQRLRASAAQAQVQGLFRTRRTNLTPREQVLEIYLTLLELGQQIGPARRRAETPYQYSRDYIGTHPDVTNEVLDLTEAFNEARYSEHPISNESIQNLRADLKRIREEAQNHLAEQLQQKSSNEPSPPPASPVD